MNAPLLEACDLVKDFRVRHGRSGSGLLRAVDGVSLRLEPGEILGLVGESGCGKSTLARLLLGLHLPDSGQVSIAGETLAVHGRRDRRQLARRIQIIFQNPHAALNPSMRVGTMMREVLRVHGLAPGRQDQRIREVLAMVGLGPEVLDRHARSFSGGQLQRLGIARALLVEPDILVADEPVSALDVSIQAQVLNILAGLRRELGLAIVFIAHDLRVVEHLADRMAVMYLGRIVEEGPGGAVYGQPRHPYTRGLLAGIPAIDAAVSTDAVLLEGDPPSPFDRSPGCRFAPRCRWRTERCLTEEPELRGETHRVACHLNLPEKEIPHE